MFVGFERKTYQRQCRGRKYGEEVERPTPAHLERHLAHENRREESTSKERKSREGHALTTLLRLVSLRFPP